MHFGNGVRSRLRLGTNPRADFYYLFASYVALSFFQRVINVENLIENSVICHFATTIYKKGRWDIKKECV